MDELDALEKAEKAAADPQAVAEASTQQNDDDAVDGALSPVEPAAYATQHATVERAVIAWLVDAGMVTGKATALAHEVLRIESPLSLFAGGKLDSKRVPL